MQKIALSTTKVLFFLALILNLSSCKNDTAKNELNLDDEIEGDLDSFLVTEGDSSSVNINELVNSKDQSQLNEVQLVIQNLLKYCAEDKIESASKIIAYMGDDNTRMYKDHFNYNNASERSIVNITCDVIKKWLKESSTYEFISYETTPSEIGTIHSVEVMFQKQGVGINRRFFRLVNSKKGMILVAMD